MTIPRHYAERLARQGRATIESLIVTDALGRRYQMVTRHDVGRVDNFRVWT